MFAIPGVCALITFVYVRPQEFLPLVARVPFLYLFFALAVLGVVLDLRLRIIKPLATPQLPWALLLLVWMLITVAINRPAMLNRKLTDLTVLFILYVVIAQGVQSFRGLEVVAATLVALLFFLTAIGIHQGYAPFGCVVRDHSTADSGILVPDGRPCDGIRACYGPGYEPGKDYSCEHVGLLGTTSVAGGRIRYRGILQDPNELALATGCSLAFAFAFVARRRNRKRMAMLAVAVVLVAFCGVLTKSRGGQLVFLAVLGTYFVRRYGPRGLLAGFALAAPLLFLGGRGGEEAAMSTMDRYQAWSEGFNMIRAYPLFGVGQGGFTDHYRITAHNSYLLALCELGFIGFFIWAIILYLSIKILVSGVRRFAKVPGAQVARDWGLALLAAMIGMCIGILFLSMSFHWVLWIYLGLCGAYYSACKSHDPDWHVRLGGVDVAGLIVGSIVFFIVLRFYVILKLRYV